MPDCSHLADNMSSQLVPAWVYRPLKRSNQPLLASRSLHRSQPDPSVACIQLSASHGASTDLLHLVSAVHDLSLMHSRIGDARYTKPNLHESIGWPSALVMSLVDETCRSHFIDELRATFSCAVCLILAKCADQPRAERPSSSNSLINPCFCEP